MRKKFRSIPPIIVLWLFVWIHCSEGGIVKLPKPQYIGKMSIEEALNRRRSVRRFASESLTPSEVSQLLWACAGKTFDGLTGASRAYPSAGALHPLEIYIVVGNVTGINNGIYRYGWKNHTLLPHKRGDFRDALADAAIGQGSIAYAPICIVITAVYSRTSRRYGRRGEVRYVHMEAGHAGQNIYLQAEALNLRTVAIGAFYDGRVERVLELEEEVPLYLFPVGRPQR